MPGGGIREPVSSKVTRSVPNAENEQHNGWPNGLEIQWDLRDPFGNSHRVIRTWDGFWHGRENVGREYAGGYRGLFLDVLEKAMRANPDMGVIGYDNAEEKYSWLRL